MQIGGAILNKSFLIIMSVCVLNKGKINAWSWL